MSIIFLGYRALYANYPFSLLDSWSEFKENILWVCLTLQCSANCCICCTVVNCTYCVYQNHPNINICLPDSATLRSLLVVSTSLCVTASTTASLSFTPARAPTEDQITFSYEQRTIMHYSWLHYTTLHYTTPHHTTPHHTTPHHTTLHFKTMCPRVESQNRELWLFYVAYIFWRTTLLVHMVILH